MNPCFHPLSDLFLVWMLPLSVLWANKLYDINVLEGSKYNEDLNKRVGELLKVKFAEGISNKNCRDGKYSKINKHLRLVFETLKIGRIANTVYSISVQILLEHGKPGSCNWNSDPHDRKMTHFFFCAIHYRIALQRFARYLRDRDPLDRALMTSLNQSSN